MRPIPYTHLSLPRYADNMGINPIHFQGAAVSGLFQHMSDCNQTWTRHTWQSPNQVSHEDLAKQIVDAERTIGDVVGFPVAPEWLVLERPYPKSRPSTGMRDRWGEYKSIALNVGEIIAPGVRGTQKIDTFNVVYTDDDGDGFKETATVTLADEPDWENLRFYYKDTDADQRWEIRPVRSIDTALLEIRFDSWLLIKPELRSAFPTDQQIKVDISTTDNLVTEIDAYIEYNNTDAVTAEFIWSDGSSQNGFVQIVDHEAGIVRPSPANFEESLDCFLVTPTSPLYGGYEPEKVRLKIYAGKRDQDHLSMYAGYVYEPLSDFFAEAILMLATARLRRDMCGCLNVTKAAKELQEDMSLVSPQGNFLAVSDAIQNCKWGTRRGEWLAWNRVNGYSDRLLSSALV